MADTTKPAETTEDSAEAVKADFMQRAEILIADREMDLLYDLSRLADEFGFDVSMVKHAVSVFAATDLTEVIDDNIEEF